jgi:hypothetical protein
MTTRETIEETTVGQLLGVRVPMGNMTRGSYQRADGAVVEGPICALALEGGAIFVGTGSEVAVGGGRWRVVSVDKEAGQLGSVTLELVG